MIYDPKKSRTDLVLDYHEALQNDPERLFRNDQAIKMLTGSDSRFNAAVEIGCGISREFYLSRKPEYYLGLDNLELDEPSDIWVDYKTDISFPSFITHTSECLKGFDALVSLDPEQNMKAFDLHRVFEAVPSIQVALTRPLFVLNSDLNFKLVWELAHPTGDVMKFENHWCLWERI